MNRVCAIISVKRTSMLICFIAAIYGCGQPVPQESNLLQGLSDAEHQFEKPKKTHTIEFPVAHAPHKKFQQEWWYLTANLTTETGELLATQWTLFRRGVEDKHWYFAHAALADSEQHYSAYREGREELGNVEILTQPFLARIDDWQWYAMGKQQSDILPAQLSYGSELLSKPNQTIKEGWQVKLDLSSGLRQPQGDGYFLQGKNGFSKKHHSLDISSHYYSQPFIEVKGEVYWNNQWQKVTGHAWLDREWGSQMLAEDQQGWDWFSLRLNDNTALMVYRIRSTVRDYMYGSLMYRNGDIITLSEDEVKLTSMDNRLFKSQSDYPQSFQLAIESKGIELDINIINDKQIMRFGIEYFEGMVSFKGSHQGQGFLEMTGYR